MVLHYAVVLYTRLAPYREYYLHLSYANFYVKARKIYKFLWDGGVGFQKSPPAGSDFALRASQGQSQLLAVPIASPKTLGVREERPAFHAGFQIDFISNFGNSILNGLVSTSPFFIFLYNFHVPMVC